MSDALAGLVRLRAASVDGSLEDLCREHDVVLLVVFGSALDRPDQAADLDLAVRLDPYHAAKVLPLLDALSEIAGKGAVDLMVLNTAGPVAREQALVYGEPLFEATPNVHAEAQIAASMERMDTDHLRQAQLQMLREGSR